MNTEKAIDLLDNLIGMVDDNQENDYDSALHMAIDALKTQAERTEERTETHSCDCISRKEAIEALQEHRNLFCDNTPETFSKLSYAEKSRVDELDMAIATLINLPSAQPDSKELSFTQKKLDTISRQAVIEAINKIFPADPMRDDYTQGITCGAALANIYVAQLPSAQPEPCEDTISRQAAIEAIENTDWYHLRNNGVMMHGANSKEHQAWYKEQDVYKVLNDVPSVQPETCDTCKHGYFGDTQCDNCCVRYPSHYERRTDE